MAIKIIKKKILKNQEYIVLSGAKNASIKAIEKRYKGEFRLINNQVVIVRPVKK